VEFAEHGAILGPIDAVAVSGTTGPDAVTHATYRIGHGSAPDRVE